MFLGKVCLMESVFSFFESLFKNFTWGRLTFLIFAIIIASGGIFFYEAYTNHFKLGRISEELKIIEKIIDLEKKVQELPGESPSKQYFTRLMLEADKSPIELNFQQGFSSRKFERLFFQALPWIMMVLLISMTSSGGRVSAIVGVIGLGSPFVVLGYNLPDIGKPWLINYLYPWGVFVFSVGCVVAWQSRQKRKSFEGS
ncbi:hypothetical protein BK675_02520 [Pseudomonas fluorescens]|nr:hypothetical protein BK677_05460 [Pseudomonas fluorescens]ROO11560.1 hypothetical protein BK675_02520 [Pseudomonas fluorescens]ROO19871.1 hypothetical protein BK676_04550 [Pseudomonas fluorescens]